MYAMQSHPIVAGVNAGVIRNWRKQQKAKIIKNEVIAEAIDSITGEIVNIVSPIEGTLKTIFVEAGGTLEINTCIAEISYCTHPAFFKSLCVSCGTKIIENESKPNQTILAGGLTISLSKKEATAIKSINTFIYSVDHVIISQASSLMDY